MCHVLTEEELGGATREEGLQITQKGLLQLLTAWIFRIFLWGSTRVCVSVSERESCVSVCDIRGKYDCSADAFATVVHE